MSTHYIYIIYAPCAGTRLVHRLQRWPNLVPAQGECVVFTGQLVDPNLNSFNMWEILCPSSNAYVSPPLTQQVESSHTFTGIMSSMWIVLCLMFVVEGSTNHKKEAIRGFILHQSNPPCRDVNKNKLIPCTLTGQEDYQRIMSANSPNPSSPELKIGCKDGLNNMTCLPLSLEPVEYICACSSKKGDLNTGIGWNDIWEEITQSGLVIKRSLCDAQSAWCLDGMFKTNLVYLVKQYAPLDSQITVSSVFSWAHEEEKVRLEYNGEYCAWLKAANDVAPWVKFDLLHSRVATGVKIGKRCDDAHGEQYVTSFHLATSADDVTWSVIFADVDVEDLYDGDIATWWFDNEITARYWRIEPITWMNHASMQADIIGYI